MQRRRRAHRSRLTRCPARPPPTRGANAEARGSPRTSVYGENRQLHNTGRRYDTCPITRILTVRIIHTHTYIYYNIATFAFSSVFPCRGGYNDRRRRRSVFPEESTCRIHMCFMYTRALQVFRRRCNTRVRVVCSIPRWDARKRRWKKPTCHRLYSIITVCVYNT